MLSVEIPFETKQKLKEEADTMWKTVDEAIRMHLGMDENSTEAALRDELEKIQKERESFLEERELLESKLESLEEREQKLEDKLDTIEERKQSYQESIDDLLDDMVEQQSKTILAWSATLKELANQEYGRATEQNIETVVGDIRSRRDDRNLAIPDHRFARTTAGRAAANSSMPAADGGNNTPELRTMNRDTTDGESDE